MARNIWVLHDFRGESGPWADSSTNKQNGVEVRESLRVSARKRPVQRLQENKRTPIPQNIWWYSHINYPGPWKTKKMNKMAWICIKFGLLRQQIGSRIAQVSTSGSFDLTIPTSDFQNLSGRDDSEIV